MPLVTITGNWADHGLNPVPANLEPRLWFKPNKGHLVQGGALDGDRVTADLSADGSWTVDLWSEPTRDLYYTLVADWLRPDPAGEPTEERSRAFFEWHVPIYPGEGGTIGDVIDQHYGLGIVYCGPDAPLASRINQLHLNIDSWDLYERVVTW